MNTTPVSTLSITRVLFSIGLAWSGVAQAGITYSMVVPDPLTLPQGVEFECPPDCSSPAVNIGSYLRIDGGSALDLRNATFSVDGDGGLSALQVIGAGSVLKAYQVNTGYTPWPGAANVGGSIEVSGGAYLRSQSISISNSGPLALPSSFVADGAGTLVEVTAPNGQGSFQLGDFMWTTGSSVNTASITNGARVEIDGNAYVSYGHMTVSGAGSVLKTSKDLGFNTQNFGPGDWIIMEVADGALVNVGGSLNLPAIGLTQRSVLKMSGGNIDVSGSSISVNGVIDGYGTVKGAMRFWDGSLIRAHGGTLTLGDESNFRPALLFDSEVVIEENSALQLNSKVNPWLLSPSTVIKGGTLRASAGVALDTSRVLFGHGAVDAALTAKAGSTIVADGDLALGRADRVDGVFSDGILMVGNHTVTLKDRNQAVLGSLTELGNGEGGGVLKADNGILLDFGRNLVGHGTVIGSILNNGYIEGVGPSADDYLELRGYVRGVGDFAGTIAFSGVFSPGLSPTDSNVENVVMLPTNLLEIEIGGRTAGSQFDRISASGFAKLGGTLKVSLIDGFVPVLGDSFTFLLASNGITQQFSAFDFPTFGTYPSFRGRGV